MLISESNHQKKLCAISYASPTFFDLKFYLQRLHGLEIIQLDPDKFSECQDKDQFDFINLVTNHQSRQDVALAMDEFAVTRFSLLVNDTDVVNTESIGLGCFIYPHVTIYPSAIVGRDVLIHAQCGIAHQSIIKRGCYFSGSVTINGSCHVNEFCWFGTKSAVLEKVRIPAYNWIAADRVIRSTKEFRLNNLQ